MNHRDRATPIALPRNAPISQTIIGLLRAKAFLLQDRSNGVKRALKIKTVKLTRIDQRMFLNQSSLI